MRKYNSLTAIAAASVLALGFGTAANAAVTVDDGRTTGGIDTGAAVITEAGVEFNNYDLNLAGPFVEANNTATVTVGQGIRSVTLDFDTDQAIPNGPRKRGIYDFSVMVAGDMGSTFTLTGITDPDTGVLTVPGNNTFDVQMGEQLTFVFSGTAFASNSNFAPGYSVAAFGNPVPVPAAGLLFGTAAIGGAIARRRRKAS